MLPEIDLIRIDGKVESFADYSGKTLLIVNVASNCGFTPQYKDLQQLYLDFKGQGFEVLAFPCNQFGKQEPGTPSEIREFAAGYGLDVNKDGSRFHLMEKINVNGRSEGSVP